jgi:hypothetical protein
LSSAALAPEARRPRAAGATSICWKSFIEWFLTQELGATAPHAILREGFGITHYQCARKHNVRALKSTTPTYIEHALQAPTKVPNSIGIETIRHNGLEHLLVTNHDYKKSPPKREGF